MAFVSARSVDESQEQHSHVSAFAQGDANRIERFFYHANPNPLKFCFWYLQC